MRLRSSSSRKKLQTEEFGDGGKVQKQTIVQEKMNQHDYSPEREARFRIYSCVFCEFVRDNLSDTDLGEEEEEGRVEEKNVYGEDSSDAFEAKYLYHLSSVHGLRR